MEPSSGSSTGRSTVTSPAINDDNKSSFHKSCNSSDQYSAALHKRARIKIVGIDIDRSTIFYIRNTLLESNRILRQSNFLVQAAYSTDNFTNYGNVIISCSRSICESLVSMGTIMYEGTTCRLFPYYDILQCFNCQDYGHSAANCKGKLACRTCAGNHCASQCNRNTRHPSCVNCARINPQDHPQHHRSTYDACPQRQYYIHNTMSAK